MQNCMFSFFFSLVTQTASCRLRLRRIITTIKSPFSFHVLNRLPPTDHNSLLILLFHVLTPQGLLTSLDDFYLLGSSLLMTQTSIGVFNVSLFSQLSPLSLLAWQRVRLANFLAHSGEEWVHIFSKYNSGAILLI